MPTNLYGTPISQIPRWPSASADQAQAVIDSAIAVWMQMGLSEEQIMYGIAMLNVESGYNPIITNGVPTDTIRGLGQFAAVNWRMSSDSVAG